VEVTFLAPEVLKIAYSLYEIEPVMYKEGMYFAPYLFDYMVGN
jgi:hypothetical protein